MLSALCAASLTSETTLQVEHSRQNIPSDCVPCQWILRRSLTPSISQTRLSVQLSSPPLEDRQNVSAHRSLVGGTHPVHSSNSASGTPAPLSQYISVEHIQNNSAVGTSKSQHSHSDARGGGSYKSYQRRPMLRMQRLCISLLSGLVSWSAAISEVEVYTKAIVPPITCSRTK